MKRKKSFRTNIQMKWFERSKLFPLDHSRHWDMPIVTTRYLCAFDSMERPKFGLTCSWRHYSARTHTQMPSMNSFICLLVYCVEYVYYYIPFLVLGVFKSSHSLPLDVSLFLCVSIALSWEQKEEEEKNTKIKSTASSQIVVVNAKNSLQPAHTLKHG